MCVQEGGGKAKSMFARSGRSGQASPEQRPYNLQRHIFVQRSSNDGFKKLFTLGLCTLFGQ